LAYFYFNPEHPSLTSGQIRPPNTVRLLTLEGRGANTIRTVYATETQFEFLAPNLAWQGNDRLYLARSRFAEGQIFGIDRFSIVAVQLPAPGSQSAGQILASNYELPNQQKLRDFAACRTGESALMVIEGADGSLQLARWDHAGRPEPDQALGDRRGIVRTAHSYVPMDEALALVAVDLGGRAYCVFEADFTTPRLGQLGTDLIFHLFETLAIHARMNLHAKVFYGRNDHHKVEALFKALARALDAATAVDPRRQDVPSTKGTLTA